MSVAVFVIAMLVWHFAGGQTVLQTWADANGLRPID